jgi:hypothetical protein
MVLSAGETLFDDETQEPAHPFIACERRGSEQAIKLNTDVRSGGRISVHRIDGGNDSQHRRVGQAYETSILLRDRCTRVIGRLRSVAMNVHWIVDPRAAALGLLTVGAALAGCADSRTSTNPTPPPVAVAITGTVADSLDRPVSGARVEVRAAPPVVVFTDGAGAFTASASAPPGIPLPLEVTKDRYLPFAMTLAIDALGRTNSAAVRLNPASPFELTGRYTMTVTASASCTGLPAAARARSYGVTASHRPPPSRSTFNAYLDGATFLYEPVVTGSTTVDGFTIELLVPFTPVDAFTQSLTEELADGSVVMLSGRVVGDIRENGAVLSGPLQGRIESCRGGACVACQATDHQLTLQRQ